MRKGERIRAEKFGRTDKRGASGLRRQKESRQKQLCLINEKEEAKLGMAEATIESLDIACRRVPVGGSETPFRTYFCARHTSKYLQARYREC